MNQQPEDRDWEHMLDRLDLETSAEELAAAERAMRALPPEQVEPVEPAWVEATVARALAATREPVAPVVEVSKPVLGVGWWDGVKRFAAVIAFLGMHAAASAATVTVVVTTAVVVSVLWPQMADSDRNMSFATAVAILESPNEPEDAKAAAMFEVARHVGEAIRLLQAARGEEGLAARYSAEARAALDGLAAQLQSSDAVSLSVPSELDFPTMLAAGRSGAATTLEPLYQASRAGISSLQRVGASGLHAQRDRYLGRLRASIAR